jgi:hypothetical protein
MQIVFRERRAAVGIRAVGMGQLEVVMGLVLIVNTATPIMGTVANMGV